MSEGLIKPFRWNIEKNSQLQTERGVGFEAAVIAIAEGKVLDVIEHPNQQKYPSQRIFIIEIDEYVYLVPFVESSEEIFFKTMFPSRTMKKKYLGK